MIIRPVVRYRTGIGTGRTVAGVPGREQEHVSPCQNDLVAKESKKSYVDNGWPRLDNGDHAVTELSATRAGGLSPYGEDTEFPVPAEQMPYVHPHTVVNR